MVRRLHSLSLPVTLLLGAPLLFGCPQASGGGNGTCPWDTPDAGSLCATGGLTPDGGAPSQETLTNGETAFRNLTYGSRGGFALQGDLFVSPNAADAGIVVVVHGGGWVDCGRRRGAAEVEAYAQAIASATQAAAFNVEYRLPGEGGAYPNNVGDLLCAVEWISKNAASYGLDGQRIAIAGESTGGQLALSAAFTRQRPDLDPGCGPMPPISLVVTYSAPTDLPVLVSAGSPLAAAAQTYAGSCGDSVVEQCNEGRGCTRCIDASPAAHACEAGVAKTGFMMVHAPDTFDQTVPLAQAQEVQQAFSVAGVASALFVPSPDQLTAAGCAPGDSTRQAHGFSGFCLTSASASTVLPVLQNAISPP